MSMKSLAHRYSADISEPFPEVTLVSSNGLSVLQQAVTNVTHDFLSQSRNTLRSNGIFKMDFDRLSEVSHSGSGNNATDTRTITFKLEFEFIPDPTTPEGVIEV
ncbi:MAG: hypothetical protein L0Y43_06355, partial [Methylococcaceae bacterium]|nr:hypothetical protein [Methylococcaceae bacterium]